MRTHVRAVVVGGGAVGAGIAYHLAKAGWTDTVLLERDELTSGSTWHAAGLLPLFNMGYATSHIHDHSVKLYKTLEAETGLNAGFSVVGNLRMAQTEARMDEYRLYSTTAESVGIPHEFLTPAQIRDRWPLVRTEDLKGALFHPTDGYINPADVTQAMAKGARQMGVEIVRRAQVDGYRWTGSEWIVSGRMMVEKGGNLVPGEETFEITAEHVVTATGNHAQRTAGLLGLKLPAIPVEHQYIVTEPDPALVEWRKSSPEHPVLRDADAKWYVREERGGWILGPYERGAPARFEWGVPDSFRADLFPLDLERIEEEYMSMIHRIPSSEAVGLKDDFNGPICYTPDGNPLVGPAPGLRNLWLAEGFSFGITAAGGTGHYLAQMMVGGEAEIDMASLDPRRFGSWMTTEYAARKNEECYAHVFVLHHPDEEREACRPLRTAPCYDRVGPRRPVRPGQRLGTPELLRARRFRRPRRPLLPPRRLVAIRRRGGARDPRQRRPDRRHRLHQARGPRPRRHRLPRLVHHQPPAEGRPAQPHLRAHPQRHHPHGVHHLAQGRAGVLPRLRRRLDRLRRGFPAQGRRGPRRRVRPGGDPERHHPVRRLRARRPEFPRAPEPADPRRRARDRAFQQALPLALRPPHRAPDVPGRRAPRRLYRRARLGTAPSDRDAELPLRPADGGRRAHGPEARRRPCPELAAPGEDPTAPSAPSSAATPPRSRPTCPASST
jgi:glycine/D-amino acid oxidase-like deaminating enzyme